MKNELGIEIKCENCEHRPNCELTITTGERFYHVPEMGDYECVKKDGFQPSYSSMHSRIKNLMFENFKLNINETHFKQNIARISKSLKT